MAITDDLKTFEKIYPIFIQKYETFIPSEENSGVTEKINSMIQYLSQIGRLNNDVVNNWNKVMEWLLSEGLGEVANIEINRVLESGTFDDMMSALVTEQTTELDILVEGKVEELESILVDLRETGTGIDAQARDELITVNQQLADTSNDLSIIPYSRQKTKKVRNLITFYFDDAMKTDLTNLKIIADAKGIPLSIAAISSYNEAALYLSDAELRQLQTEGWQIDSHTHTHPYLATLTDEEIEYELKTSRDLLRSRGLNVSSITYPFGSYDERVMRITSKYYRAGLASAQGTNTVPIRTQEIRRVHMKDYTLEDMKSRIDNLNNGWIVFYGHSAPNWEQLDIDKFVGLIDYAQLNGVEIVNVDEALDAFENKFEVNDPDGIDDDYFKIGADGNVYSPQLNKLNHIFTTASYYEGETLVKIDNATPISFFQKQKVTSTSFAGFHGLISIGSLTNIGGTLITYRLNDDDVLNHQMFIPYNNVGTATRFWTVGGWGAWRQNVLSTELSASHRFNTNMNAFSSTVGWADFENGTTVWDINSAGATGYPSGAGTVTMHRSAQGHPWSYQIFDQYQSANRYKRWMTTETVWSAWVQVAQAIV